MSQLKIEEINQSSTAKAKKAKTQQSFTAIFHLPDILQAKAADTQQVIKYGDISFYNI